MVLSEQLHVNTVDETLIKLSDDKKESEHKYIQEVFCDTYDLFKRKLGYLCDDIYKDKIDDLIFSENFIKFLHDDKKLVNNLINITKGSNWGVGEYMYNAKKLIKNKLKEYKEQKLEDLQKTKDINREEDIFKEKNYKEAKKRTEERVNNVIATISGQESFGTMFSGPTYIMISSATNNINPRITDDGHSINQKTSTKAIKPTPQETINGGMMTYQQQTANSNEVTQQNLYIPSETTNSPEINQFLEGCAKRIHVSYNTEYNLIKSKLEIYGDFDDKYIVASILSEYFEKGTINEIEDEDFKNQLLFCKDQILSYSQEVKEYFYEHFEQDIWFEEKESNLSKEVIDKIVLTVNQNIKKAGDVSNTLNFNDFKQKISEIVKDLKNLYDDLNNGTSGTDYITKKMDNYLTSSTISEDKKRGIAMLYAFMINCRISSYDDLEYFIETVQGKNTKYTDTFDNFINQREERHNEWLYNQALNSVFDRYKRAQALAESRRFYGDDLINLTKTGDNPQDYSGLQIASGINNIDEKLNHYKLKSDLGKHGEVALKYTAFETTFNNIFNLSDTTVQKLVDSHIDLRSDLINYGIYHQESNSFNKDARNKFVSDKLGNIGLAPEEIDNLGKAMENLPSEVKKNYEILCGNFDTDQNSFEKISKIYALGEVIDNIKTLFSGLNSKKLGDFMNLQLDENEPADVKGDYLFIKGKVNGTETNIKYDLRTGKLYMNSFTSQTFNPPKIIVGNTEPNWEIGDLGSFEEAISNLDSAFQIQSDGESGNNIESPKNKDVNDGNESEDKGNSVENSQNPEKLIRNKLNRDLKEIGVIVKERAGEQGKENNIIDSLLKTFNILPESGEPRNIEFIGGSKLFTLLESIRNTSSETELLEFSNQMNELMALCELSRGKNNENPKKSEFSSITIFDIDENNASTDIISLQKANKDFFLDTSGEKDKIKNSESHFDSSIQLSFANIIVQKCCRNTGNGRKISANEMKSFVKSIKDGISDGKELLTYESMFEDDNMLA